MLRRMLRLDELAGSLPPLNMPIEDAIRLAKDDHAERRVAKWR